MNMKKRIENEQHIEPAVVDTPCLHRFVYTVSVLNPFETAFLIGLGVSASMLVIGFVIGLLLSIIQ